MRQTAGWAAALFGLSAVSDQVGSMIQQTDLLTDVHDLMTCSSVIPSWYSQ